MNRPLRWVSHGVGQRRRPVEGDENESLDERHECRSHGTSYLAYFVTLHHAAITHSLIGYSQAIHKFSTAYPHLQVIHISCGQVINTIHKAGNAILVIHKNVDKFSTNYTHTDVYIWLSTKNVDNLSTLSTKQAIFRDLSTFLWISFPHFVHIRTSVHSYPHFLWISYSQFTHKASGIFSKEKLITCEKMLITPQDCVKVVKE